MIDKLANSERVEQVFVRHAFRFWMGRNETLNDAPVLQAAHKSYRDNGGSMRALITSPLTSDAFRYRKVESKRRGKKGQNTLFGLGINGRLGGAHLTQLASTSTRGGWTNRGG